MKIYGPGAAKLGVPAPGPRPAGGGGFALPELSATADARPTSAPRQAGGIDALLAMQGVDDIADRRRRTVQRGRGALDALDGLKIALLSGTLDGASVERLRAAAAGLTEGSGDPGLDAVLSDIELRVEVELAKAGAQRV